jgi:hypothetical protein
MTVASALLSAVRRSVAQTATPQAADAITDNFFEAIISPFTATLGIPLTALVVFGSIGLAYYQVQRSIIIPVIMLILVGSVTLSQAPASAGNAVIALAVVALASMGYIIYTRTRER